jgi:cyclophilin family peptidyl-prolyl cis-trans isomerase
MRKIMRALLLFVVATVVPTHAGTLAQFRTAFGDIEVELFDQDKPVTVSNFVQYVKSGRFTDTFIHRCLTNFVIQGGGYYVSNHNPTNVSIAGVPTYGRIPNEFGVGRRFSNVYGTIAMAKLPGDTNSATSQWYFNLANNTDLDAADSNNFFVVFGRILRGTNVLNAFTKFKPFVLGVDTTNVVANFGGAFTSFPMLRSPVIISNVAYIADSSIAYTDISLLNVQLSLAPGSGREISWNSITGLTNRLEFTERFSPPSWQVLTSQIGTGTRMTHLDNNTNAIARFYRVVVNY